MARKPKDKHKSLRNVSGHSSAAAPHRPATPLRIIGGSLGGRKLIYATRDDRTRPMKDRVREAVFNLVGPDAAGKQVVDLFAGTGALAFEALSRGAASATLIEQHFPTAAVIRQNAAELQVSDRIDVRAANAFVWAQQAELDDAPPWLVFCSPPYAFYTERREAMAALVGGLVERAPSGSIFVVEADRRFDLGELPDPQQWETREYPPAVVAIYRK